MIPTLPALLGYIDPGTGSLMLQALVAGLLGAAFTVKTYWKNISSATSRLLGRGNRSNDTHQSAWHLRLAGNSHARR